MCKSYWIYLQWLFIFKFSFYKLYYNNIMIDLNAIEKGEIYRYLKESIVIFICKFDPFGEGFSKYTSENIYRENRELYLKDGTSKVFFNTKDYYKRAKKI